MNPEKQNRHIKASELYDGTRSYIYGDLQSAQNLVDEYHGKGDPIFSTKGNWTNKEVVTANKNIGVNIDKDTGIKEETNRFVIHYSKRGTHIVPTRREKKTE